MLSSMLSAMWIWRRTKCSITLHNQEFYTLARPSSYARKSAHLKGRQFHCCSLIRCNCVSLSTFIEFYFCCTNFTMQLYEQKWGHFAEQEKTRTPLLTRSEVGQRLLFIFTISLLGLIASKTHPLQRLHPVITAASPPRRLGSSIYSVCALTIARCSQRNRSSLSSLSSPPPF